MEGEPQGSPRKRPAGLGESSCESWPCLWFCYSRSVTIAHLLVGFTRQGAAQVA